MRAHTRQEVFDRLDGVPNGGGGRHREMKVDPLERTTGETVIRHPVRNQNLAGRSSKKLFGKGIVSNYFDT